MFSFLIGLVIGSFLNVCIYRIPRSISVVVPGSYCPHCKTRIPIYYNIPVLAFLWLRGRCRFCAATISYQYPMVEMLMGILSLLVALKLGMTGLYGCYLLLISAFIVIAIIDWRFMIIARVILYPTAVIGMALCWYSSSHSIESSFAGIILGGGLLLLAAGAYRIRNKREGLGMGDVYLAAVLGICFGWNIPHLLALAAVSALAYGLVAFRKKEQILLRPIPFGSFLAIWGIVFCLSQIYS